MKPNHSCERGNITDIIVNDECSVTHITFTDGAVRGNHYHKNTIQYDTVIKGKLICATDKGNDEVSVGMHIKHLPNSPHAYKAIGDAEIISICFGLRKGDDYSLDTYKLDTSLL